MLIAAKPKAATEPNLMQDATQSLKDTAQTVQQTAHGAMPEQLREPEWAGIRPVDFGMAFAILICAVLARWLLLKLLDFTIGRVLRRRDSALAAKVFAGTLRMFGFAIILTGLFLAFSMLELPHKPVDWAGGVWRFYNSLLIIFAAMLLYRIVDTFVRVMGWSRTGPAPGVRYIEMLPLLRDMAKVVLAICAVILIVQSWGYNATALIAGVGIGGLALAFAAQDTIANVFGSLVIYADRPFKTGDWVEVNGVSGNVEEVGIRSTRIRTFEKCLVTIPNKAVTAEKLYNWGAITHRRMRWYIGVDYHTAPALLEQMLEQLRALVGSHEHVVSGMWLVNLETMGNYSLNILVQAYVNVIEYQAFLDCQEQLILKILRLLAELDVKYALPGQPLPPAV